MNGRAIDFDVVAGRGERRDLRGKQQAALSLVRVQRLDAESIPHQIGGVGRAVEEREREHAAQLLHHLDAMLFVEMHECFGIGVRLKHVAA